MIIEDIQNPFENLNNQLFPLVDATPIQIIHDPSSILNQTLSGQ